MAMTVRCRRDSYPTPKEPNARFLVHVGPIQSGAVATVPPRTNEARSAPGRRARRVTFRWSRKRGGESQKII